MKKLILIGGMPAAGKTTVGKALSRALKLPYLDKDTLCDQYTNYVVEKETYANDRNSELYKKTLRPLEYEILWTVAMEQVSLGLSTIVVAPFTSEFPNKTLMKTMEDKLKAVDKNFELVSILIEVDEITAKEQMKSRNRKEDEDKLNNWNDYIFDKMQVQRICKSNVSKSFKKEEGIDLVEEILNFLKK